MAKHPAFSKHSCGLPSVFDSAPPEMSLRPVLQELADVCKASDPHSLVVDLSENNFTTEHLRYFAQWLSDNDMHLYALDLSLNRIYSASWADVLPSIDLLWKHVELLHLGGNYLPALHNIPALQRLQKRKVAFLAQNHSFSSGVWVKVGKVKLSCLCKRHTSKYAGGGAPFLSPVKALSAQVGFCAGKTWTN